MLKLIGIFFRFMHECMCIVELNKFGDIIIKCI